MSCRATTIAAVCASLASSNARAQANPQPLLQLEVADSIGLPLPDAKLELFALLQGGIVFEWVTLDPADLPEGIDLIRVSQPGYTPAVLSVPLQVGSHVALRVRLNPEHDTSTRWSAPEAQTVSAKGFAIQGRMHTDVIGTRRVLGRSAMERSGATGLATLLGRAHNTDLKILPTTGGSFRPLNSPNRSFGRRAATCTLPVLLNGDRRRILPFEAADQLVSIGEIEAIEIFPRGFLPAAYSVPPSASPAPSSGWCEGLLVVWLRA
jgi:hypothetical protein